MLFVPATERSTLAKQIRKVEFENKQGRQSRIKVVERTGSTVLSHLSTNYSWAPQSCKDEDINVSLGRASQTGLGKAISI